MHFVIYICSIGSGIGFAPNWEHWQMHGMNTSWGLYVRQVEIMLFAFK